MYIMGEGIFLTLINPFFVIDYTSFQKIENAVFLLSKVQNKEKVVPTTTTTFFSEEKS